MVTSLLYLLVDRYLNYSQWSHISTVIIGIAFLILLFKKARDTISMTQLLIVLIPLLIDSMISGYIIFKRYRATGSVPDVKPNQVESGMHCARGDNTDTPIADADSVNDEIQRYNQFHMNPQDQQLLPEQPTPSHRDIEMINELMEDGGDGGDGVDEDDIDSIVIDINSE